MEYKLLTANDPKTLTNEVNAMLSKGWKPHGSPKVAIQADVSGPRPEIVALVYIQAVVRGDSE